MTAHPANIAAGSSLDRVPIPAKSPCLDGFLYEAQALREKHGFANFKLKGGVLDGDIEMETCRARKKAFLEVRINIAPQRRVEP